MIHRRYTVIYEYVTEPTSGIRLEKDYIGFDVETSGLNPRKDSLLLVQLSDGERTYIFDCRVLPSDYMKSIFNQFSDKIFIAHNAKFDVGFVFANYGILIRNVHDTMLAEAVLNAGRQQLLISLKDVVAKRFGIELDKSMQSSFLTPTRAFTQEQLKYAAADAAVLIRIYEEQIEEILEGQFTRVMKLENLVAPIVSMMEFYGVRFAPERLAPVIDREDKKAKLYEQRLHKIAGRVFNPRSVPQTKKIFHELADKTGIEKMRVSSTGADVIKYIKHPFAKNLLAYRKAYKIVSTYGIKLIEKMEDDGRIHCNYRQYGASTGRFSSAAPNLQNIPKDKEFRRTFIASDGYMFATVDYSQIELRLSGIVSGEPEILAEYRKADADLHRLTASKIYSCKPEDVTMEQRNHGKTGNFSVMYGTSARGMSTKQNLSYALCKRIINGFWSGYPILRAYKNKVASDSVSSGFSITPLGRIRYLRKPEYNDPVFRYKISGMKREAFNMVVQGFAADVMKYAMVRLYDDLGDRGRLLMQVHDEVGVEVKAENDGDAEETTQLIVESLEKSAGIMVNNILPMSVNAQLLDSWTK